MSLYSSNDLKGLCLTRIGPSMELCMRPFGHKGKHRDEGEQRAILETCGTCHGSKRHLFSQEDSCSACHGTGTQPKKGEVL